MSICETDLNEGLVDSESGWSEGEDDLIHLTESSLSQAVVFTSDWTVETIIGQIAKGNIQLDPPFQRREAWRNERKSRFIESLILGLPVPQLVLAASKGRKGSYVVLDGKQRLLAVTQFARPGEKPLKLEGLTIRKDLIGRSFVDLSSESSLSSDLDAFQNQTIRCVVVKNWPNEEFLYLVFHRLNTGTVPLSPQELRQALHPGPFTQFATQASGESAQIKRFLGTDALDFRMRDVELVVRHLAFRNYIGPTEATSRPFWT